jgi:ABC-type phosphate/phosphonate transport system ATPase subunit
MESYWYVIIISNVLFFGALLWFNQTNKRVVEALLDLSQKQNVSVIKIDERVKENCERIKRMANGEVVFPQESSFDYNQSHTLYDYYDLGSGEE